MDYKSKYQKYKRKYLLKKKEIMKKSSSFSNKGGAAQIVTPQFNNETLKEIYNLQKNTFTFGIDKKKQTYLLLIENIKSKKILNYDKDLPKYSFETNIHLKNNIYTSYDKYLTNKYKFEINNQTIDRIRNYYK